LSQLFPVIFISPIIAALLSWVVNKWFKNIHRTGLVIFLAAIWVFSLWNSLLVGKCNLFQVNFSRIGLGILPTLDNDFILLQWISVAKGYRSRNDTFFKHRINYLGFYFNPPHLSRSRSPSHNTSRYPRNGHISIFTSYPIQFTRCIFHNPQRIYPKRYFTSALSL
jgi:hypothetical protein